MSEITLTLTADEAELVVDALEADRDEYLEGAEEARAEKNGAQAALFSDAAERIEALLTTLREMLPMDSN